MKANNFFNYALKHYHEVLGKKSTTTDQLDKIGREYFPKNWLGVFPLDIFKKQKMKDNQYCIVNLDNHDEVGSHWVAVTRDDEHLIVWDSFGRENLMREKFDNGIVQPDPDADQKVKQADCGARCLAWITAYHFLGKKCAMKI